MFQKKTQKALRNLLPPMHNISLSPIHDASLWDSFLAECRPHTFLHSWNWGEFNKHAGNTIWRLGIFDGDLLLGVALIIKISARRGSFLFCPQGPVIQLPASGFWLPAVMNVFCNYLKKLALEEKVSFIRISPLVEDSEKNRNMFRELEFRDAPIHMHPERAWMLDITKPEDELLREMRKQTRHCIRNAASANSMVRASADPRDIALFYALYQDTVERQDFVPFSQEYMHNEFDAFAKDGNALIFLGINNGNPISGALVLFSHGSAFYHHGASSRAYQKISASHLLQWEIIKEAKRRGCALYNFWGIAPEGAKNHPWAGLTLFKKGFGGFSEEYLHAQDMILHPSYWFTYAVERVRRLKRGL